MIQSVRLRDLLMQAVSLCIQFVGWEDTWPHVLHEWLPRQRRHIDRGAFRLYNEGRLGSASAQVTADTSCDQRETSKMSVASVSAIDPMLLVRAESGCHGSPSSSTISASPSPPPVLKRSADDDLISAHSYKSSRSSEEEKLARRLARQQRNRKSAQVSREKKKAYIDQLEHDVAVLRSEKQVSEQREKLATVKRMELEGKINDLNAKVHRLESVVSMLLKVKEDGLGSESQKTDAFVVGMQQQKDDFAADKTYESLLNFAQTSAAPAAASTLVANVHSTAVHSDPCTRLPAVKATSSKPLDIVLAQQRVHSAGTSPSLPTSAVHRPCRRLERPMAAALTLTTSLNRALRPSAGFHPMLYCLPQIYSDLRSPPKTRLFTGTEKTPMLRLRFKIPQNRLAMVLSKYSRIQPVT